jgi:hypothetical protein
LKRLRIVARKKRDDDRFKIKISKCHEWVFQERCGCPNQIKNDFYIVLRRGDALAKSVARLQNPRHFSQKRRKECLRSVVSPVISHRQSVDSHCDTKIFPNSANPNSRIYYERVVLLSLPPLNDGIMIMSSGRDFIAWLHPVLKVCA